MKILASASFWPQGNLQENKDVDEGVICNMKPNLYSLYLIRVVKKNKKQNKTRKQKQKKNIYFSLNQTCALFKRFIVNNKYLK